MFINNEPFIGSDIKDALDTFTIVNKKDYNSLKTNKEMFDSNQTLPNLKKKISAIVEEQVRKSISSIPAVRGPPGAIGRPGPAGGTFQSKGSLSSAGLSSNGVPSKTAFALAPIGNSATTPIIFGEPNLFATTEWTHTADHGYITNNSLIPKTLCIRHNPSSNLGKNNLLELTTTQNKCASFTTDNSNRLRLSGTNQCVTVKKKGDIPTNIQIPRNTSYCNTDSLNNKTQTCTLDNNVHLLGVDTCNTDKLLENQVFRFT